MLPKIRFILPKLCILMWDSICLRSFSKYYSGRRKFSGVTRKTHEERAGGRGEGGSCIRFCFSVVFPNSGIHHHHNIYAWVSSCSRRCKNVVAGNQDILKYIQNFVLVQIRISTYFFSFRFSVNRFESKNLGFIIWMIQGFFFWFS